MNKINRRQILNILAAAPLAGALPATHAEVKKVGGTRIPRPGLGMYINMHWSRNYPYCARSWTVEDWDGYADGLKKLGYDSFLIWPMFETIPDPPTPSDQEWVERLATVTRRLQTSHGMRVDLLFVPNVSISDEARKYRFEERPFFNLYTYVDPSDRQAMSALLERREELLRPLAHVDGVGLIDSDPAGYPGATNAQFIHLLLEHRKMLDRLRPGLQLDYHMFLGWEASSAHLEGISMQDHIASNGDDDLQEILIALSKADPEPWGLWRWLVHPRQVKGRPFMLPSGEDKLGLSSRVRAELPYGAIELDPSFPMTNFGDREAFEAGVRKGSRGVVGVPQVHQLQLPYIFAFAQGARGGSISRSKYVEFADQLIVGKGETIVRAWEALASRDPQRMRVATKAVSELRDRKLVSGYLRGLLIGSPSRFLDDLRLQLELKAAALDLIDSVKKETSNAQSWLPPFVQALGAWQRQHGYSGTWLWDYRWDNVDIDNALQQFDIDGLDEVFHPVVTGDTPMERYKNLRWAGETQTKRLVQVLEKHVTNIEVL